MGSSTGSFPNGGIYAYHRSDLSRAADKDFTYRALSTDTTVLTNSGMATDGSHFWIANSFSTARAFRLTDDPSTEANEYGTWDQSRDITFSFDISGLHIDGDVIWAINSGGAGKAEARRLSDGARLPDLDVNFGNLDATRAGVWYNGVTMFVVDRGNDKVFTYRTLDNGAGLALTRSLTPGQASLGLRADLSGLSDPDGIPDGAVYRYRWLRDCTVIPGATGVSYQPTEANAGQQLTLRLSYTDAAGQDEEIFADAEEEEGADTVIAVPWHWELTPPSQRAEGSEFRLLFLTDTGHAPDSTDIADYNAYIQQQVALEGSPASLKPAGRFFRVLASTADVSARDNTATNFSADDPGLSTFWLSRDGSGKVAALTYSGIHYHEGWFSEDAARLRTGELISNPTNELAVLTGSHHSGLGFTDETLGSDKVALGYLNGGSSRSKNPLGPRSTDELRVAKTTTTHRYYALSPVFRVGEGRPKVEGRQCRPDALLCATVEGGEAPTPSAFTYQGTDYVIWDTELGQIANSGRLSVIFGYREVGDPATATSLPDNTFSGLILEVGGVALDLGSPTETSYYDRVPREIDIEDLLVLRFYGLAIDPAPAGEQVFLELYSAAEAEERHLLVSPDSPLNSGSLAPGAQFRMLFVTYLDHTAHFCAPERGTPVDERCGVDGRRTIDEYNAFVQEEARQGAWSGNPIGGARRSSGFRALVSTDTTDARDNTDTLFKYSDDNDDTNDELGVPIYWLLGDKVADNYQDFYDGSWSNPAAARDRWGDTSGLGRLAVATGSRDDGTVDPTGFLGESGSGDVRAGPSGGGLQGESLLDGDQGLRIYALSPIFEVRKPPPDFTVTVEAKAPFTDADGMVKGDLKIRASAAHPAGQTDGAQIDEWEFQGRSLIVKISERELFQQTKAAEDNDASATWGKLKRGHWYALRAIAHWDQGRWTSDWIYARAGYGRIFGLDLEPLGVPVGTARARAELPQTKPGGVRGLSASAGETGVALSWREPEDNGDGHPVFYRIERALEPGQWEELEPGTLETTWTDPSPPESGNVFYRVAAYNAAGAGPWLGAALQLAAADPNTPATGQPTISGTAQVGETLTADTRGISDDDGRDNVSFSYQWQADDADIADATGSTYTLAEGDEGKAVKVKVSFDDDAGNEETLTSAAAVVAAVAAAPAATPLTASHEDAPASHDGQDSFTFKLRFSEEVALSYVTLKDHAFTVTGGTVDKAQRLTQESNTGWTITVQPSGTADVTLVLPATTDCAASGAVCTDDGKQLSAALTLTVPGPEPPLQQNSPAKGAPTISGTARVDETLAASTSGIADEDGLTNVSYGYQWLADDADIAGATAASYTLADAEQGKAIKVRVSFDDDAGNEETLASVATARVEARLNNPATGAPTISGTARVGETLAASTSGIADADGLANVSYSYQWQADDSDIAGATAATYTLADAEQGKTVRVRVSFDDDAGNEEALTSAATAAVAPKPNTPATGAPTIGGTARVGETLTASTSGITDANGLVNVSFSYQWISDDADIAGATGTTYTLTDADQGKTIKVRVSFDDDAGNEETLTSAATAEVVAAPPPLTAWFEDQPSSHDGQTAFTFELHFSEEFGVSYATLRDHAFSVTGGTVSKAQRLTQGSNLGWRITVTPGSDAEVSVVLPETTDCDDQGAICAGDGRMLSNRNGLTVSGPGG